MFCLRGIIGIKNITFECLRNVRMGTGGLVFTHKYMKNINKWKQGNFKTPGITTELILILIFK